MHDQRQRYYEEEGARSRGRQGDDSRYADRSWRDQGDGRGRERDIERWEGEGGSGSGPKDYQRSDERIREEVSDHLTDDPRIDATEISVQVSGGLVTLSGSVMDRDQKRRAEDMVERISGVRDVTNNIRVGGQS